jgi:putative ABC transport system ATP-binding protein
VDLSGADDDRRAAVRNRRIGFVFQQSFLLERATAVGNVMLPLLYGDDDAFDGAVTRAERALAAVGLVDRGRHRPTELSGGEQQRVAIARALINDPAVILADEPTGSLDEQAAGAILEILRRLVTDGRSVVLVTHDQAVAARADRTLTLDCGRLTS